MARELGAEVPGQGGQLPLAPILDSDHTFAVVMVILLYAGFAATLGWALYKLVRGRETLPLVLTAAGLIACNAEPLGDHVGLIVYAPDIPWFDFWVMGRQMPSFILVGLASYVAVGSYYACRMLQDGASLGRIAFVSAVLVGIPEVIMEVAWHRWDVIRYYGDNPTRILGIPLYTIIQNTTLLPVYGAVTFAAVHHGRQLWLILLLPFTTIGYIVGATWPVYEAIQSSAAAPITWACAAISIALCCMVTYAALMYAPIRELRDAAQGGPVTDGDREPALA